MRVLALTNGWPTNRFPEFCVFNQRQVEDIRKQGVTVDLEFVNARENGKIAYLQRLPGLARKARGYDVVHCFHGLSFLLARLSLVRRPLVVSFLNAIDNEYIDLPNLLRPHAIRITRRLVTAPGAPYGVIVKDRIPPELEGRPLVRYLPNGIDMDFFQPGDRLEARRRLGLDPQGLYLLFVSSKDLHRPQKRFDRFSEVLDACRAANPGRTVEAITLVSAPGEVVRQSYQAADVHVLTSDFEGSPNSVKEAMACALPVVSTDVGNVAAMAGGGLAAARVLPEFSVDEFMLSISEVLAQGPEARLQLRESIVAQGLDGGTVAKRIVELYRDVSARG